MKHTSTRLEVRKYPGENVCSNQNTWSFIQLISTKLNTKKVLKLTKYSNSLVIKVVLIRIKWHFANKITGKRVFSPSC